MVTEGSAGGVADLGVSSGSAVQRATVLVVAALCLLAITNLGFGISNGGPGEVPMIAATIALPLLYVNPATRPLWLRHRYLLLAVQAALSCVPYVLFGSNWPAGATGWLAGLVLLTTPAPASWFAAVALAAIQEAVQAGVIGLSAGSIANASALAAWVIVFFALNALVLFGLARLANLVAAVHAARGELAEAAVNVERVRAAQSLRAAIGNRLTTAADRATATAQAMADNATQAREHITATATAAREALAEVREVAGRYRNSAPPDYIQYNTQDTKRPLPGEALAPRIAQAVLVAVLCALAIQYVFDVAGNIDNMPNGTFGAPVIAWTAVDAAALVALQLRHSWPTRTTGRPRGWPVTLALQVLLSYVMIPVTGWNSLVMFGFLAGSALLLLPGPAGPAAFTAVSASVAVVWATTAGTLAPLVLAGGLVFATAGGVAIGLLVYGLTRLAWLAMQLENLRGELARGAVADERLRVSRDTHDLLGLGLSAVAMKADLIDKLIGRDDARAGAELAELTRICAAARADLRLVAGEARDLPLDAEFAAARDVLESAGINVRLAVLADPPPETASILVPVLREAVTNVLKHSNASYCTLELTADDGVLRLLIGNDGGNEADGAPLAEGAHTGNGLRNLAARLEAAGGRLTTSAEGSTFDLAVELPLPVSPAAPV